MKEAQTKAVGIVILLLILVGFLTLFTPSVHYTGDIRLRTDGLPAQVGGYEGTDIYFCQNQQCLAVFSAPELRQTNVCPKCGSELNTMSPAERGVLPADTMILKKRYSAQGEPPIFVSVVFSGENQRSIHRPQRCLPGQGYVIENTRTLTVPRTGKNPLKVEVLSVRTRLGGGGEKQTVCMTYAYWYTGGDYETPFHFDRLAKTAMDRIFKNRLDRWAYVALSIQHNPSEDHTLELESFISHLYPLIQKD
jgi:hypothetical protein